MLQRSNLYRANEAFAEAGFHTSIMHAQISRSKPILGINGFVPLNPVFIVTAQKGRQMSNIGTLYGLGVGPGDPELITVKAFHVIQESPVIAYPKKLKGSKRYAHRIVEMYIHPEEKGNAGACFSDDKR